MAYMEWNTALKVGIAIFDDEHKKLIAVINRLHEALQAGCGQADLLREVDHLIDYTAMHFRHEEMYFDDWSYPAAKPHCASHAALYGKMCGFRHAITSSNGSGFHGLRATEEMLKFLKSWWFDHILIEDQAYGTYLMNKGVR
ncbi:hemerythrin-like metal-binding protein [Rhizomicrobium palustre]|uniref:Hemerythrin-like metal-binding protein n=1 Tax=Rhizomicrobium palustre TaxID=189966 RepID=A0A846MYC1_9PROT|nr:bacteriohemerythrin [Rhizomicrobium palustre]NIK88406.1 hemerythrin-like metal-binding protein [Rhizomicrobium palustre]